MYSRINWQTIYFYTFLIITLLLYHLETTMYEAIIKQDNKLLGCYTRTVAYWSWYSEEVEPQYDLIGGFTLEYNKELNVYVLEYTPTDRVMWTFKTEDEALEHLLAHVNEMKASNERMQGYVKEFKEKIKPYSLEEQYKDKVVEVKRKDYTQTPVWSYLNRLQAKVSV